MRILIMVLSSQNDIYPELRKTQQETWDSIQVDGVETIYYLGGSGEVVWNKINESSQELILACSDDYYMMHWKFKQALLHIEYSDFDFIFKTNASSYVNKKLLLEFAETLPKQKCNCGIDGGGFASGCGVFFSKDCLDILKDIIDEHPVASEDGLMSSYLNQRGIGVTKGAKRLDVETSMNYCLVEEKEYHYRVKNVHDRKNDIMIMKKIFEKHGKPD
ncbi:MAG: hypothetical protein V4547_16990 [Bacteroidota bacterium]